MVSAGEEAPTPVVWVNDEVSEGDVRTEPL